MFPKSIKEKSTHLKDVKIKEVLPVENDWQDPKILPRLKNHLDVLTKCPGIYPAESIIQFNKSKLERFFGELPQYS